MMQTSPQRATRSLLVLSLLVALAGCDNSSMVEPAETMLENSQRNELGTGIYLIERWTIEEGVIPPLLHSSNEIFAEYHEEKFQELVDEEPEPTKYIALNGNDYIPLELASDPKRIAADDGRTEIELSFTPEMSNKLTEFSRNYLGRQVALVIGGEIVTIHKVRSVLTGEGLKISRCTDDGCELILARLKK